MTLNFKQQSTPEQSQQMETLLGRFCAVEILSKEISESIAGIRERLEEMILAGAQINGNKLSEATKLMTGIPSETEKVADRLGKILRVLDSE
ncbi:hypothetical protein KJ835_01655 [Patescibacteria group bacterium]|nr:hypothetical protein [Patescibacteria group bacterium]